VLTVKNELYVTVAQSIGAKRLRIIVRHLIPNVMPEVIVRQTYVFGVTILIEGALNFLGIGVQPEIATLGSIIADGRRYLRNMPWICFYAGLAISILVLGINLLGDGLRDVLDPKMDMI
jgi:peptide/nickel transport system permease protein